MKQATVDKILDTLESIRFTPAGADGLFVGYIQDLKGMAEVTPVMGQFTPGHCTLILSVLMEHMLKNYDDTCKCDGCDWALKTLRELHDLLKARRRQSPNSGLN